MLQPPATTSRSFLIPLVLGMMQVELSNNCRSSAVFISSHIHQAILQIHQLDIVHKHSNCLPGLDWIPKTKTLLRFLEHSLCSLL